MILSHLSSKSLTRALTVSKYWRQVILGPVELRRSLFLEPSSDKTFLQLTNTQLWNFTITSLRLSRTPSQSSRIVVKAHPVLMLMKPIQSMSSRGPVRQDSNSSTTHAISKDAMQRMPSSTLLFQPSSLSVKVSYLGHSFVLEAQGGLTFGALAEGLQDLCSRCLPCTPANLIHAQARGLRIESLSRYDGVSCLKSDIFLTVEDAICDDSKYVRAARKWMGSTDW